MKRSTVIFAVGLSFGLAASAAAADEWSDIPPITGRFSNIYFDYQVVQNTGTFYCINDWRVNRDDGGVNGGLVAGEYNRFTFGLGSDAYEVRIFPDGSNQLLKNGVNTPGALPNFRSSTGWRTSPNDPDVKHTIWEWAFDVVGTTTTLTQFVGCDPPGPSTVVIQNPPPVPTGLTSGPSAFAHLIDAAFSNIPAAPALAPTPNRPYQAPVRDPWFAAHDPGWDIVCKWDGGVFVTPEPAGLLLLILGVPLLRRR
jgi:hypothetical protein